MVILNNLGWLDFGGYSAAAISIGLLMFFIGYTVPGRSYVLLPYGSLYYLIGAIGILLIFHGLLSLYRDRQLRHERQRQEERLMESKVDYLQASSIESDYASIANEDEELPEISFEQSLMEEKDDN